MKTSSFVLVAALLLIPANGVSAQPSLQDQIVALERGALDKWIHANPQGYLDLYAPDFSYFDPFLDARVDGIDAMKKWLAKMMPAGTVSPIIDPRYEFISPRVQRFGEVAILTFNLVSYGKMKGQPKESVLARWNSTETYRLTDGKWKIVHSHWSFTKPDIKPPAF